MKVETLEISRRPSYDTEYAGMLVGMVRMRGDDGTMEVKLSNQTVADIFTLIKDDVKRVAKQNAQQANHALAQAVGEHSVLEHTTEEERPPQLGDLLMEE